MLLVMEAEKKSIAQLRADIGRTVESIRASADVLDGKPARRHPDNPYAGMPGYEPAADFFDAMLAGKPLTPR
jgi:hypothetical protein